MPETRTTETCPTAKHWVCGHCGTHHWKGNVCGCAGFTAARNLPESLDVDDIELDLPQR